MRAIGAANGCENRMRFLEDGVDADDLIELSRATVLCNSTVGFSALRKGKPVYCLGQAVYKMPGLATGPHAMPLARFWRNPPKPDMQLVEAFVRVLKIKALVRGNFYSPQGRAEAVEGSLIRMGLKQA
jgi:capsular polysaccharide export protein